MDAALVALENSALAVAVREGAWTYPLVQILHLLGLVALLGAAGLLDLRLLGFGHRLPVALLADWLLPVTRGGFALTALSGFLLFAADARALAGNTIFHVKLAAVIAAGVNAWIFHRYVLPCGAWHAGGSIPLPARVVAFISLACWIAALTAGRLIAYFV